MEKSTKLVINKKKMFCFVLMLNLAVGFLLLVISATGFFYPLERYLVYRNNAVVDSLKEKDISKSESETHRLKRPEGIIQLKEAALVIVLCVTLAIIFTVFKIFWRNVLFWVILSEYLILTFIWFVFHGEWKIFIFGQPVIFNVFRVNLSFVPGLLTFVLSYYVFNVFHLCMTEVEKVEGDRGYRETGYNYKKNKGAKNKIKNDKIYLKNKSKKEKEKIGSFKGLKVKRLDDGKQVMPKDDGTRKRINGTIEITKDELQRLIDS